MNHFATDFPILAIERAARGEDVSWTETIVMQGHTDYCRANGHATWTVDGVDRGTCPRCGEVTR